MTDMVKAITGARLIDGSGGKPVDDSVIVIKGDRFEKVGRGLDVPKGAEVVDAAGRTVLPGLIDSHLHLCSNGDPNIFSMLQYPMGLLQLFGYRNALNELEAGFTTVRDMGAPHGFALSLRQAVEAGGPNSSGRESPQRHQGPRRQGQHPPSVEGRSSRGQPGYIAWRYCG